MFLGKTSYANSFGDYKKLGESDGTLDSLQQNVYMAKVKKNQSSSC